MIRLILKEDIMSDYMQYVEKFAKDRGITPAEAEEHYIVKLVKR